MHSRSLPGCSLSGRAGCTGPRCSSATCATSPPSGHLFWKSLFFGMPQPCLLPGEVCSETKIIDLTRASHGTAAPLRCHELPNPSRRERREFLWLGILSAHARGTPAGCCCPSPPGRDDGSSWGHVMLPAPGAAQLWAGRLREHQGFPSHRWEWKQQSLLPLSDVPRTRRGEGGPRTARCHRTLAPGQPSRAGRVDPVRTRRSGLADTWLLPQADGSAGAPGGAVWNLCHPHKAVSRADRRRLFRSRRP